jgi:hypothetical protein
MNAERAKKGRRRAKDEQKANKRRKKFLRNEAVKLLKAKGNLRNEPENEPQDQAQNHPSY